jgi:hypothetical protein
MLGKIKKTDILQFLRFCVVGTPNVVIDFGVINLLLWLYPTTNIWKTPGQEQSPANDEMARLSGYYVDTVKESALEL